MSATDVERQERGVWSSDSWFAEEPKIPAKAVKRWQDPAGYEHIDQAPHLLPFNAGDRVVYGRPGELGTIVRSAHCLLPSWIVAPENNPVHHIVVPLADVEKLRPDNMPRALGRAPSEAESDEEEISPNIQPLDVRASSEERIPSTPGGDAANNAEDAQVVKKTI